MVKHKNIVNFDVKKRSNSVENIVPVPQLVISAQTTVKRYLQELLPKFFSQIDDSLFNLADKAANNQQQTMYFDAMREIRLQYELMEKIFFSALESGFKLSLSQAVINQQTGSATNKKTASESDQMEETVALSNMANAAEVTYRNSLSDITTRLNFLIENIEITNECCPLRPEVFCDAFSISAGCMNTDIKIRLVVYKLFDKLIIQQLGKMYDTINADFIASGVLPRLNIDQQFTGTQSGENPELESKESENAVKTEINQNTTDDTFGSLQQALSKQKTGLEAGVSIDTTDNTSTDDNHSDDSQTYTADDIVAALSQLQIGSGEALLKNNNQESSNIIRTIVLKEIKKIQGAKDGKQIAKPEKDSINIVSRLFDFILDDPCLSGDLKLQIARLQIPLLKVAILDSNFFSRRSHPARLLLNELAYAGNGVSENNSEEDSTHKMVSYVVDRILTEFEENTDIFASLLNEFVSFMENEKESNKLTTDMIDEAKDFSAKEIQNKITNHNVPPLVKTILLDVWKDVMVHLYLRDGIKSNAWETALRVADDLIWSVEPKLIVSQRNRLIKVIPSILNGLRDGFTLIKYDTEKSDVLFDDLEALHLTCLQGGIPNPIPDNDSNSDSTNDSVIHYEDSDILTEDDFGIDLSDFPENAPDIEEKVVIQQDDNDILYSLHAETINEMKLGTWVEFIDSSSKSRIRGKLAWKCDITKEYTFVDRKYKVVADVNYRQLIEKFDSEHASIVEDIPLFDRAMDSIVVGIKQALVTKNPAGNTSKH